MSPTCPSKHNRQAVREIFSTSIQLIPTPYPIPPHHSTSHFTKPPKQSQNQLDDISLDLTLQINFEDPLAK
jgi:hypothetical protein